MKRQGNTGIWTFVLHKKDGNILACSEWGTNYTFSKSCWEALTIIE